MTTIAYRNGILAADTQMATSGSVNGSVIKIARREDGALVGAAGYATYAYAFMQWFLSGEQGDPPKADHSDNNLDRGVIFGSDGYFRVYEVEGMFVATAPYYAFGGGMDFALGAMHAGAGAKQAIEAAIAHDPNTGGDITVLSH